MLSLREQCISAEFKEKHVINGERNLQYCHVVVQNQLPQNSLLFSLPQTVPFISLLWKAWQREEEAEQLSMSCYTEIKMVISSCLLSFE